jgi:D-hydroxyproline dehydrogenase subunit beta
MSQPTGRQPDAVVVGAGIVGAACALALAQEGLRVQVVDAGAVAGGTTSTAMGHLVVMDDSPAQLALTAWSLRLWAEIAPELPADCEHDPCGTLWLAAEDAEMDRVHAKAAVYRASGVAAEVLDGAQLAEAEPGLRAGLAGALRVPGDRVLYPPNAARFLLARAVDRGAELRQGFPVSRLASGGVEGRGERITAPIVVNAAGAAAPELTQGLPLVPRKGHLVITDRSPGRCHHQLVELGYLESAHGAHGSQGSLGSNSALASSSAAISRTAPPREVPATPESGPEAGTSAEHGAPDEPTAASVAFNVQPRATGQLLIGSSRELAGWDRRLNRRLARRMIGRALDYLPGLGAAAVLRTWIGFRPATFDNLPLIGAWPHAAGVWIASGHEGLGITTSLATGRLLADLVAGRQPPIDPAPFAPGRPSAAARAGAAAPPGAADRAAGVPGAPAQR